MRKPSWVACRKLTSNQPSCRGIKARSPVPGSQDIHRVQDFPGVWPWPRFEAHQSQHHLLKNDGGSRRARSTRNYLQWNDKEET